MNTTGVIQYVDIEGGFYGIVADDGTRYDPVNLSAAFKEHNLPVHFTARILRDMESSHMWGTMVELIEITTIETR